MRTCFAAAVLAVLVVGVNAAQADEPAPRPVVTHLTDDCGRAVADGVGTR